MKMSARNLTDLVVLYTVLFQGFIVMIIGRSTLPLLDTFFINRGAGVYLVFLLVWSVCLLFLRRILIAPYHQIFCLFTMLCHLFLAFNQWTAFIIVANTKLGKLVSAGYIELFSHTSMLFCLLFISWLLIYTNRSGERII